MRLPEFTAEASLYKISEQYHMVNVASTASISQVVPAMPCCSACEWALDRCELEGDLRSCSAARRCFGYCSPYC